ncbi:MAG: SusC/RagA family TonB-linked outer membrane protein [Bacteroidales bacterium]
MEKLTQCFLDKQFFSTKLIVSCLLFLPVFGGAAPALSAAPVEEAAAQQRNRSKVTGVVTDETGEPLIGATIVIEGQAGGTVTDIDGKYSLEAGSPCVLIVSYVGYRRQTINYEGQPVLNIRMELESTLMDEVVVVAYGIQKKVSVTAAISTVETKELKQSPSANLATSLAGRLPGLTALQSSGQPGNDRVNLYLRGLGTLNDASPLILIDGIPRSNISTLDPNEIATVTILKDASATAVFGVRGANGVILITTRRGKTGKLELSLSADYSVQSFLVKADRTHSWDFAELRNQAARNDNPGIADSALPFTQYMIDKYRSGEDPVFYPDRDVFHDYFRDWSPQKRLNANFNGGSEDFSYFLNVGYIGQGGNFKTEPKSMLGYDPSYSMNRYNFRGNIDYNIAKNLKASLNLASYLEKMNSPQSISLFYGDMVTMVSNMIAYAWATPPTDPGPLTVAGYGAPAGEVVAQSGENRSTYDAINRRGYSQTTTTTLNSSLALEWGLDFITKGLSAKSTIAFDSHALTNLQGIKDLDIYRANVARSASESNRYTTIRSNVPSELQLDKIMGTHYYMNYQASLEYARGFGNHNVTGMALFQRDNWDSNDYYSASIPYNVLGLVGRATYNYDNRYLAEFNIGYNGSEQFAPKNRFGTFPAVSLGWVASNEKFLKDNRTLTNLKLRASYGLTGNDKLGESRFLYQSVISMAGGIFPTLGLGQSVYQGLIGNEKIQWEVAEKKNVGLDVELFKTISLTADFYNEYRDKILISRNTVPVLQGVPLENIPKVNLGVVDNRGFETELTYQKIFNKDFSMTVKGNFAYNENKVNFADEVPYGEDYVYRYRQTGFSIGQKFGYLIDYSNGNGYINTAEELALLPTYDVGGGTPRLGDFKYLDLNNDGVINDRDQVPIGYPDVPQITYGLSGTLNYRDFDLSFLFTGIANSSYYMTGFGVTEFGIVGFYSGWHKQAWTPERYAAGDEILYPALSLTTGVSQQRNNVFIMNRSFVRLKNLEIGYKLPGRIIKPLSLQSARFYINGNNLWTWKKYPVDTVDPEQEGNLVYGLTRMINFGINVVF